MEIEEAINLAWSLRSLKDLPRDKIPATVEQIYANVPRTGTRPTVAEAFYIVWKRGLYSCGGITYQASEVLRAATS